MSELQAFSWIAFVLAGMSIGFMSGYYIGYDNAMGVIKEDPRNKEWYRWPRLRVPLDDICGDYQLARELNDWLQKNINKRDFVILVIDDESRPILPHCMFYIKDRNTALTLSIKHNITYVSGYGKGYQ